MEINQHAISLLLAFLLDKLLGDPACLPHPIVWFGKSISFCEKKFNSGKRKIAKGMLVSIILISIVFTVFFALIHYAYAFNNYAGIAFETIFIFFGLAGTTLIKEGKAVFTKLEESLDAGRNRVARIVGRDTSELSRNEVCAATLETLAENLSDGVIAPLFWYAIAGVPGMMTYKMINTLDSMIGYKNEKFIQFGRFAAKLDDVANFIPARITAILMALVSLSKPALIFIFKYGKSHSSPNSGYPEAALAGILNVRFGGAHLYFGKMVEKPFIGNNQRDFIFPDIIKTIWINRKVEFVCIMIMLILCQLNFIPI